MSRAHWLCGLLAACGGEVVVLAPPDLDGAATLALAVREQDVFAVTTFDLAVGPPELRVEVEALASFELYALVYAERLDELDLGVGPLEIATDISGRELPKAVHELTTTRDGDHRPTAWRALTERPDELADLRVMGKTAVCTSFDAAALTGEALPPGRSWAFVFPRGEGEVLAATTQGELFAITIDGRVQKVTGPPAFYPRSGARDDRGTLWMNDNGGRIWRGDPGTNPEAWVRVDASTGLQYVTALDVAPDGSALVIADFFDSVGIWTSATGLRTIGTVDNPRAVLWLGEDDVAVARRDFGLARLRGGTMTNELTEAISALHVLRRVEGVGIVAGSVFGELFVRQGEQWTWLGDSGSGLRILSVAPFAGGLVWGSESGFMGQHVGGKFCAGTRPVGFWIDQLHPIGDALLLLGDARETGPEGAIVRRN